MFIFLIKSARLHFRSKKNAIKYLDNISKFVFDWMAKLYFSLAQTTQFAIPDNFFHSMDKISVKGKLLNAPKNVQKYLEWRYGANWQRRNKNWRLTDGNMVFLGGCLHTAIIFRKPKSNVNAGANIKSRPLDNPVYREKTASLQKQIQIHYSNSAKQKLLS